MTVTEEDQAAIAEAAASFMEANSEETLEELSVSEDQVKTYLELQTYLERMHDPMVADVIPMCRMRRRSSLPLPM